MSHSVDRIKLKSPAPGTERFLTVHRFKGKGSGPKVYLQAALHADEWPGLLTLQHLIGELIALDKEDKIIGEIVIVPYANPMGMDQKINGVVLGRQSFSAEGNFNRNWPDLSDVALNAYENDNNISVADIKQALLASIDLLPAHSPLSQLKATLLSLSIDADIVLDVHCDSQALVHLYSNYRHQEEVATLARFVQSPIVLLEDEPGGSPFDAAHIRPWIALEHTSINHNCFAVTLELRGSADVSDELAIADANGLLDYLANEKIIDALAQEPAQISIQISPLAAVDSISAPASGIVCFNVALGDVVEKGQKVAEIVNLEVADPAQGRTAVYSRTGGILFATQINKLVSEGENIAKIAGNEELINERGGSLLTL
ncbi:succinylglutamate desuccinylase/aspartoacylase family protein [Gammaproteobacteria bacterium AS21]